jgi:hypothetical protein
MIEERSVGSITGDSVHQGRRSGVSRRGSRVVDRSAW